MRRRYVVAGCALLLWAGVWAGSSLAKEPPAPPADSATGAPTLEELRNTTYAGVEGTRGPVTLSGGRWQGAPYVAGGSSAPSVELAGDFRLQGDLDGDGIAEAVVLLAGSSGGSGERLYLAVVGRKEGHLRNVATAILGDRVQVRDARINSRRILVDVVQAGSRDAMCCPGDLVKRSWRLESGRLKEGAPKRTGRLTPEVLAHEEWVLREWERGAPAPDAPEVTLKFEHRAHLTGGRLSGAAGCNRYSTTLTSGASPGEITVSPFGSTRMMCPDSAMAVETRFLQQLAGARRIRFSAGRLGLTYTRERREGMMLFERRGTTTTPRPPNPE